MNQLNFLKSLFCFEGVFVVWIFSYQFKNALSFNNSIDITLLLTCLLVPWAFVIIFKDKLKLKIQKSIFKEVPFLFILWSIWSLFSYLWAPTHFYGTQKTLCYFLYTFSGFLIAYYVIGKTFSRIKRFLMSIAIFGFFIHLWILMDFWRYGISFREFLGTNYLVTGETLGAAFLIFFVYSLNGFLKIKASLSKIFQEKKLLIREIFLLVGATTLLYVSFNLGGRGPVLALGIALFCLYVLNMLYRPSLLLWSHVLLFSLIFMGLFYGFNHFFHYQGLPLFIERTPFVLKDPVNVLSSDLNITLRLEYYISAFKMFLAHPLQGGGFGAWSLFDNFSATALHPHNIFLEILSETGLIGFFLFISMLYQSLKGIHLKSIIKNPLGISLFLLLIFGFINALKTGDLNDNIFFLTLIALMARLPRQKLSYNKRFLKEQV
ncbi:MAG: O-antigen ligase family protein [Proteobacteria bacterium]|nr:O-antigen ligase family protein [Pseudomonadota bacterium]